MRIAVFGLGYVGAVSSACLAEWGHVVLGVDRVAEKVDAMNRGRSPIVEPGLQEVVAAQVSSGNLRATTDWKQAVDESDMAWICVGTPSERSGRPDLRHVRQVAEEVGGALGTDPRAYEIVLRSTVLPGTTRRALVPILEEASQMTAGTELQVSFHPEFLREGSALTDFREPSRIIIGADDGAGERLRDLYRSVASPVIRTEIEVAEMLKYAENAWHALKVTFANEVGSLSKAMGLDGRKVMDILCQDHKLNLSAMYLRPGLAFGGSCLPKDLRSMCYAARHEHVELPVLGSVLRSNERHLQRALELITRQEKQHVGLLGLSFKPDTDDLRESPMVEIAQRLIGQGYDLKIFDPNVDIEEILGANREFVQTRIEHIGALMAESVEEVIEHSELLVLGHRGRSYLTGSLPAGGANPIIVDLAGALSESSSPNSYHGICW
jgi:GDP-mannose 6-dehydrogenase